jgi:hypothetical protein
MFDSNRTTVSRKIDAGGGTAHPVAVQVLPAAVTLLMVAVNVTRLTVTSAGINGRTIGTWQLPTARYSNTVMAALTALRLAVTIPGSTCQLLRELFASVRISSAFWLAVRALLSKL